MYFRKIYNPLPKTVFSAILLSLFLFKKEAGYGAAPRASLLWAAPRASPSSMGRCPAFLINLILSICQSRPFEDGFKILRVSLFSEIAVTFRCLFNLCFNIGAVFIINVHNHVAS